MTSAWFEEQPSWIKTKVFSEAIRFAQSPAPGSVIRPPTLSLGSRPSCSTDIYNISLKLKQVAWFIFLSLLWIQRAWNRLDGDWKIQICIANFSDFTWNFFLWLHEKFFESATLWFRQSLISTICAI